MHQEQLHNIRNTICALKGCSELLQDELHERPELAQLTSTIAKGCADLEAQLSDILGPRALQKVRAPLIPLIEESLTLFKADLLASKVEVEFERPATSPHALVDESALKGALLNLFNN